MRILTILSITCFSVVPAMSAKAETTKVLVRTFEQCATDLCVRPVARPRSRSWAAFGRITQIEWAAPKRTEASRAKAERASTGRRAETQTSYVSAAQASETSGSEPQDILEDKLVALVAACGAGQCQNSLNSILQDLTRKGLEPEAHNEEISFLALALYSSARATDGTLSKLRVSEAMRMLSEYASDEELREKLLEVSDAISEGRSGIWELENPFVASPS